MLNYPCIDILLIDYDSASDIDDVDESLSNSTRSKVNELYAEIDRLRKVISLLTARLNFVLTMFGIDEIPVVSDEQNFSDPTCDPTKGIKCTR